MTPSDLAQLRRNASAAGNARAVAAIDSAARQPSLQGRESIAPAHVGGDTPVAAFVPVRIASLPNERSAWGMTRLKERQRNDVRLMLGAVRLPALPAAVVLTRVFSGRGRPYDDDNLVASMKAVRDELAAIYGVPDNDPRLTWTVAQEPGADRGVRVEIMPVREVG